MNAPVKLSLIVLPLCALFVLALAAPEAAGAGWDDLPAILERIKAPEFPDRDFDVTQFGAVADGKTDCSDAIKKAIAECHAAGGGRVLIPGGGTYYTGPIHLKSNVHLEIAKGACTGSEKQPIDPQR